jgi:hypothetical protein
MAVHSGSSWCLAACALCTCPNLNLARLTKPFVICFQARYLAAVGGIGYIWRDLKASTSYSGGGNENVVLQFLVGLGCGVLANVGTTCTGVDSSPFDIFAAPNPPVNLKVEPYGPLGFRLQMTPGAITRMRPLSGYMIEVRLSAIVPPSQRMSSKIMLLSMIGVDIPDRNVVASNTPGTAHSKIDMSDLI